MSVRVGQLLLVGLGQLAATTEPGCILVARPLGATAALALHDPLAGVGGLLHWILPAASIVPPGRERAPAVFADTGLPLLLHEMEKLGSQRDRMVAALAGAGSLPEGGEFDVGERNRRFARRFLEENGIRTAVDDTGGTSVRELSMEVGAGEFIVRTLNG